MRIRSRRGADAALVAAVLLFSLGHQRGAEIRGGHPWAWAFDLALALPLLARRRAPFEVFLVQAAVALLQWSSDLQTSADLSLLLSLYAVGVYERRRPAVAVAALIAELGVVMAAVRWAPEGHEWGAGILLTGTVTAAWVLGVYVRTRRAYIASVLDRAATAERERDQRALIATAAERGRISREMHDIVAHSLSVMIALSDGAAMSMAKDPDAARDALLQASTVGRQALTETRRLLGALRETTADLSPVPGIAQLDALIGQVRAAGLPIELVVEGQTPALPPSAELAAYRLVQESLTNVLKHAPTATGATVRLAYGADHLDIEVSDDGSTTGPVSGEGHGIDGMRERAAIFGGTVDAAPRPGGGWRVSGHLPIEAGSR